MINKTRMVDLFSKLVSIDAPSFYERELADHIVKLLLELGFEVSEDDAGKFYGGNCGNIYGYLKGELEGDPILFSAHMDTVEPARDKKAILQEDGRITSDGNTVLGADDVSGIVPILEAVRAIKEKGLPHRSIEVLFTIAEELYLLGSEVFNYKAVKAKEAYVLDLSGPVGTAALKAPTVISFTAKIIGKASHAGFAPEQGIHAIAAAAEAISMIKQGRVEETTTVNIGTIEGGKARNIVPDECIFKGEVRCLNHEKAIAEAERISNIIALVGKAKGAQYEFETSFGCLAYDIGEEEPVVNRFKEICRRLDIPVYLTTTYGGSDNNNFYKNNIRGIVIACGMNQVHSCMEYSDVEELFKCCNVVLGLMTTRN